MGSCGWGWGGRHVSEGLSGNARAALASWHRGEAGEGSREVGMEGEVDGENVEVGKEGKWMGKMWTWEMVGK